MMIAEELRELAHIFMERMPFNRLLDLQLQHYSASHIELRLPWHDQLIGNPMQKILHGGVTAAVLDVTGGMLAGAGVIMANPHLTPSELAAKLGKMGTIDLRTDYLRPGRGAHFVATASILRAGNKVCVCRMEMHNDQGEHIAFGTGTYLVG